MLVRLLILFLLLSLPLPAKAAGYIVRPGDTLRLEIEVTSFRSPVGKAHGRALVGDTLACEADLTFALGKAAPS